MITGHGDVSLVCQIKHVDPIDVICEIFAGLESRHRLYQMALGDGGHEAAILIEISDMVKAAGDDEPVPQSLLEALELHLRIRVSREEHNETLRTAWKVAWGYLQKARG